MFVLLKGPHHGLGNWCKRSILVVSGVGSWIGLLSMLKNALSTCVLPGHVVRIDKILNTDYREVTDKNPARLV